MNNDILIRTARGEDAAALARIYAYYVEKTASPLSTPSQMLRKWNGAAKRFRSSILAWQPK